MAARKQKKVNIDAEIGEILAKFSDLRGVRQQHVLSVGAMFYLIATDEIRASLDLMYRLWVDGRGLKFLTADADGGWGFAHDITGPKLEGDDARQYAVCLDSVAQAIRRTVGMIKSYAAYRAQFHRDVAAGVEPPHWDFGMVYGDHFGSLEKPLKNPAPYILALFANAKNLPSMPTETLQTLSTVTFRQSSTVAQIDAERRADFPDADPSAAHLKQLESMGLVESAGNGDDTRYRTTAKFLKIMGVASVGDLGFPYKDRAPNAARAPAREPVEPEKRRPPRRPK